MNWRAWLWWQPPCLLRQVILNTIDEESFQGVLWGSRGSWLVPKDVKALRHGAEPTPVDGDMVIYRDKVAFLQVLP